MSQICAIPTCENLTASKKRTYCSRACAALGRSNDTSILADRTRVEDRGHDTPCHIWTGNTQNAGYGQTSVGGKYWLVHRLAVVLSGRKIPTNLQVDHLCRVRTCCNPEHLRVVTQRTNILAGEGIAAQNARKTHCAHGHEFTEENTILERGARRCASCKREAAAEYYQANKERIRAKQRERYRALTAT